MAQIPKWHVVPQGQRQTVQLSGSGTGFTDVWEVTYHIDEGPGQGTEGTVRIPASQYNAATVKATIDALVSHQHAVASLGQLRA
jgi:hypothetical protein